MKLNRTKLARLADVLQEMVDTGFVAGVTCMVLQDGEEQCYYEAGFQDSANRIPIARNTIFRLYSMTKPITSAAVMMLLEDGKLDLLEPVSKYLPGFLNQTVIRNGMETPVSRPVTIQNLLNMTSGLTYDGQNCVTEVRTGALFQEAADKLSSPHPLSTVEFMNRLGKIPLAFEPGEKWQYGASADVLGAIVEIVSGMRFGEFLEKRIFAPLGMKDTAFYVPQDKQSRLSKVYEATPDGLKTYHGSHLAVQNRMERNPAFESGGAGLVSTIDDYAAFAQMLLQNGSCLLSPKTVEFMTGSRLMPALQNDVNRWESMPGYTYANLLRIMTNPEIAVSMGSRGEYGWDGWLGPYMTNDPANRLTLLIMQQKTGSGTTEYTRKIRNVVFSSLT
ncbi:MAG: beta-lactamase family protein [Lachnospiraceae bacterium]|mgnify:CR=1 FL=1|nr:beta-lactamase family protein [Lachnospiraceae bacterium]